MFQGSRHPKGRWHPACSVFSAAFWGQWDYVSPAALHQVFLTDDAAFQHGESADVAECCSMLLNSCLTRPGLFMEPAERQGVGQYPKMAGRVGTSQDVGLCFCGTTGLVGLSVARHEPRSCCVLQAVTFIWMASTCCLDSLATPREAASRLASSCRRTFPTTSGRRLVR